MDMRIIQSCDKQFTCGIAFDDAGAENYQRKHKAYKAGGDCEVRALAFAAGYSYKDAFKAFDGVPNDYRAINRKIVEKKYGYYRFKPEMVKSQSAIQFAYEHLRGRYILMVRWGKTLSAIHYIALIDGVLYDGRTPNDRNDVPLVFKAQFESNYEPAL